MKADVATNSAIADAYQTATPAGVAKLDRALNRAASRVNAVESEYESAAHAAGEARAVATELQAAAAEAAARAAAAQESEDESEGEEAWEWHDDYSPCELRQEVDAMVAAVATTVAGFTHCEFCALAQVRFAEELCRLEPRRLPYELNPSTGMSIWYPEWPAREWTEAWSCSNQSTY